MVKQRTKTISLLCDFLWLEIIFMALLGTVWFLFKKRILVSMSLYGSPFDLYAFPRTSVGTSFKTIISG